jgi:hypothetical protein
VKPPSDTLLPYLGLDSRPPNNPQMQTRRSRAVFGGFTMVNPAMYSYSKPCEYLISKMKFKVRSQKVGDFKYNLSSSRRVMRNILSFIYKNVYQFVKPPSDTLLRY